MVHTPGRALRWGQGGCRRALSATPCLSTPSCGRGSRTPKLHEAQKASGGKWPGPVPVESVGGVEGEAGAVLSAGWEAGMWSGARMGLRRRRGASEALETPPSSDSGGAAVQRWRRGQVGAGEVGAVG